jgi:hypothetical protein
MTAQLESTNRAITVTRSYLPMVVPRVMAHTKAAINPMSGLVIAPMTSPLINVLRAVAINLRVIFTRS